MNKRDVKSLLKGIVFLMVLYCCCKIGVAIFGFGTAGAYIFAFILFAIFIAVMDDWLCR